MPSTVNYLQVFLTSSHQTCRRDIKLRDRDQDSEVRDRDQDRDCGVRDRDRDETQGPRQFKTVQNE